MANHFPPSTTPQLPASSLRVLVVEDNDDARDMLASLLSVSGHHVWTATNGLECLDLAERHRPDVILCDLGLPDTSGLEIAASLRQRSATRRIHLIALTGYGRPEDMARSREAGFDSHLTKPIDIDTLTTVLSSIRTTLPEA